MTGVDDSALAAQAAAGDPEAFGELVARHAPMARRVAHAVLENEQDADDAAQEGFLSAWQAIRRYDPRRAFRPWLMQIVVNAARDLRRRRKVRTTEPLEFVAAASRDDPAHEAGALDLGDRLRAALAELPERQRLAFGGFVIMVLAAMSIEANLRRLGKAGIDQLSRSMSSSGLRDYFGAARQRPGDPVDDDELDDDERDR